MKVLAAPTMVNGAPATVGLTPMVYPVTVAVPAGGVQVRTAAFGAGAAARFVTGG